MVNGYSSGAHGRQAYYIDSFGPYDGRTGPIASAFGWIIWLIPTVQSPEDSADIGEASLLYKDKYFFSSNSNKYEGTSSVSYSSALQMTVPHAVVSSSEEERLGFIAVGDAVEHPRQKEEALEKLSRLQHSLLPQALKF